MSNVKQMAVAAAQIAADRAGRIFHTFSQMLGEVTGHGNVEAQIRITPAPAPGKEGAFKPRATLKTAKGLGENGNAEFEVVSIGGYNAETILESYRDAAAKLYHKVRGMKGGKAPQHVKNAVETQINGISPVFLQEIEAFVRANKPKAPTTQALVAVHDSFPFPLRFSVPLNGEAAHENEGLIRGLFPEDTEFYTAEEYREMLRKEEAVEKVATLTPEERERKRKKLNAQIEALDSLETESA